MKKLYLERFDWAPLVKQHFFENTLIGIIGAAIGLIQIVINRESANHLLSGFLISPKLTVLCIVIAYTRVWKSIREEHETAHLWDALLAQGPKPKREGTSGVLDRVVELPYVFSIVMLPFASILPQVFLLTLLLFYITQNYYIAAEAKLVAEYRTPSRNLRPSPSGFLARLGYLGVLIRALLSTFCWNETAVTMHGNNETKRKLVSYFRTRWNYSATFMPILVAAFVVVTIIKSGGGKNSNYHAAIACGVPLALLFVIEALIEPRRNEDTCYGPEGPIETPRRHMLRTGPSSRNAKQRTRRQKRRPQGSRR